MAQDTSNILKELSALSTNMDSLVRELKEQNKIISESNKSTNKLVAEITEEKKQPITKTSEEKIDAKMFEKLVSSFSKNIQNTLEKQLDGSLGNLTKNLFKPAEVKPNVSGSDLAKILGLNRLPKLKDGGDIKKEGVAVVGEEGPEIVNLKRDQKVISKQSKDFEFLKMYLEDLAYDKKRQEKSGGEIPLPGLNQSKLMEMTKAESGIKAAQDQIKEIISGPNTTSIQKLSTTPKLEKQVKNGRGFIVPTARIDAHMNQFRAEFPNADQELLDYEREDFIKYFEDPDQLQRIQEEATLKAKEAKTKAMNTGLESSSLGSVAEQIQKASILSEKSSSQRSEKTKKDQNQNSVVSPTKSKLLDSLKVKGKDIGSKFKEDVSSKVDNFKRGVNQTLSGKVSPDEIQTMGSLSNEMQKLAYDMKASQVKKETPVLNKPGFKKTTSTSDEPISQMQSQSIPTKKEMEYKSTEKKPIENSKESKKDETISSKDIKEIKGLLAGIYKSLSGPLRIANDMPFRPGSNVI